MSDRDEDPDQLEGLIRYAKVDSVDLGAGTLVASAGDVVTHGIRWLESRSGGTRTWSPPSVGEQIIILCPSGDIAGAIALRGVPSGARPYPGNTERELIDFADGTVIAYDPAAHLFEILAGAGQVKVIAAGGVSIEGPTSIKGDVSIEGDVALQGTLSASDDVVADGKSLKSHRHPGITRGGAISDPPQ